MERIAAILVILVALGLIGLSFFGPRNFGGNTGQTFDRAATIEIDINRQFAPDRVQISGGRVQLTVRNNNDILHRIELYDPVAASVILVFESIRPGREESQWVELVKGRRYTIYDPVWRDKGMEGVVIAR